MAKKLRLSSLIHEELEPRLLFSGGLETVLIDDSQPATEAAIVETLSHNVTDTLILNHDPSAHQTNEPTREVVFIDKNVENYEQLLADLSNRNNIDIFVLDSNVDGIDQISAVLANYQNLDAVHLISHGNDQGLTLGNGRLEDSNLQDYRDAIQSWQSALSQDADILLYGCNLAASEAGQALINALGELTAADIAASDDLTGLAALGGDWVLEYVSGSIETNLIFSIEIQSNWKGVLAAPTVNNLTGDILAYTEGDGAQIIEQASDVTASDGGGGPYFVSLAVSVTAGGDTTEDVLSINHQGSGVGQIGFDGTNVSYGGINIGTATGGSGGTDLMITFNGNIDNTSCTALFKNITYENTDTVNPTTSSRTITFTTDGSGGGGSDSDTTTVNITAVANTAAPVLDNTGTMTLTNITEDDTASAGDTVAAIIATSAANAGDAITDADGDPEGIAITGIDNTNGTWQYKTTAGAWTAFGAVSDTSATLLDANDLIRFVPNTDYNGSAGNITFRAWDTTTGVSGATAVDVSTNGTTTAFSTATETATLTVTAVNDAPTAAINTITATEDTDFVFSAANFNFADIDGNTLTSIRITTLEGVGALQWFDGAIWQDVTLNQVITKADIDMGFVKFIPVANANGATYDGFAFSVNDGTTDSVSSYAMTIDVAAINVDSVRVVYDVESVVVETPTIEYEPITTAETKQETENTETETKQDSEATDIVLDVDEQGESTILSAHGTKSLLHSLTTHQAESEVSNFTPSTAKYLLAENNLLISGSTGQLNFQNIKLDLQLALDELNQQMGSDGRATESDGQIIITTTAGVSIALAAGFITWALQGGSLLTALLTTLPAWNTFDPLPILDAKSNRTKKSSKDDKQQHDKLDYVFDETSPATIT